ncbi:hypothetical protein HA44_04855 [Mixta gaviniae]|nr:hypothetical protein HA44_04855 [Mixta gaviniae]
MDALSAPLRFAIICAVCLPITYGLATLLYRFVENRAFSWADAYWLLAHPRRMRPADCWGGFAAFSYCC